MAGFGTKGKIPGSENTPIHGAVDRAGAFVQGAADNVATGWDRTGGSAVRTGQAGVENAASGLRDIGHSLFGKQTAIGSIFGGGTEQAATPASPVPARAAQGPSKTTQVSAPTASARPLVVAPMQMSTGKNKTGNAVKKRKKKKGN
ncbi:MAG: hypothetical protein DRH30_00545 [Deltaproteobacteria bacterium]|nr:MAG: hypothetical protein DRH30_00545 [Deltaproteobacteria bacterium]